METRKIIILGAMLLLGGGVFFAMQNLNTAEPVQQPVEKVVEIQQVKYARVLAIDADVSTGQRISEGMLTSIKWPEEALTANLINLDDQPDAKAEFANALARQPLAQGETLTRAKVIIEIICLSLKHSLKTSKFWRLTRLLRQVQSLGRPFQVQPRLLNSRNLIQSFCKKLKAMVIFI